MHVPIRVTRSMDTLGHQTDECWDMDATVLEYNVCEQQKRKTPNAIDTCTSPRNLGPIPRDVISKSSGFLQGIVS